MVVQQRGLPIIRLSFLGRVDSVVERLDRVDDSDDGGIDRKGLHPGRLAGRAALAHEHNLVHARPHGINGDDRARTVAELGRICLVHEQRTQHQQLAALHCLVLLGRDERADDARQKHGLLGGLYDSGEFRKDDRKVVGRTRDHLDADDLTDGAGGLGAGVGRRLDGGHITVDDRGYERVSNLLHWPGEGDIGRLQHGVGAGDEGGEASGFE